MSPLAAVPITRAPKCFAICEAYEPTPPAAPWMRIVIPDLAATTSRVICNAVDPAVGSAAAVVKSRVSGNGGHSRCRCSRVFSISTLCEPKDSVTRSELLDILPGLDDFACEILPHRDGEIRRSYLLHVALPDLPVDRVYTCLPNSDEELIICYRQTRNFFQLQRAGITILVDANSFHCDLQKKPAVEKVGCWSTEDENVRP